MTVVTVAAECSGPTDLGKRLGDRWPVSEAELEAAIAEQAESNGWTVLMRSPAHRRGPIPCFGEDPDTGEMFAYTKWQLYSYLEVA